MPFINYKTLKNQYPTGQMSDNISRLQELDAYHCLLSGSAEQAAAVKRRVSGLPADFLAWLEACDGGMLFDTAMLTTKSYDSELDVIFEAYGDFYNAGLREVANIKNEWFVFAVAVHSDLYFFDMGKKDGRVYQWDVEEERVYAKWETFEDWITDQIHEAMPLVADGLIKPNLIKMELINNER